MTGILVFFHCPSNAGYAIARLERAFLDSSRRLVGDDAKIHFAYPELGAQRPLALPVTFANVLALDPKAREVTTLASVERYVRDRGITLALGFDQPPRRPLHGALRRGGVRRIASYWGAPMSSLKAAPRLLLNQIEVILDRSGPDHYIFESEGMRRTATEGRGIPRSRTSVTYLGVDASEFVPTPDDAAYPHETFGIPRERHIVFFSGHFEERKGVGVIVRAARELIVGRGVRDVHFVLIGNQPGEEEPYRALVAGTEAESHITFGGYRGDGPRILHGAAIGVIASTGWDSFTMSSLEIASSGVPLVVSRLLGLEEAVDEGRTGLTFPVGDSSALATALQELLRDEPRRLEMGAAARARILERFTVEHQVASLTATLAKLHDDR